MKLAQKLVVSFLALALLPTLLIGALMYQGTQQTLTSQVHSQLESVASIQSTRISTSLSIQSKRLTDLVGQPSVQQGLSRLAGQPRLVQDQVSRALAATKASSTTIQEVLVTSPTGIVLASTDPARVGTDLSSADYIAAGRDHIDFTNFLYMTSANQTCIYQVAPVINGGALAGVAVIKTDLSLLFSLVQDHPGLGDTGEVMLIKQEPSGRGLYLTPLRFDDKAALTRHTNPDNTRSPFMLATLDKPQTLDLATDYRGNEVVAAVSPIAGTNWRLAAKIDRSEAYAGLTDLLTTLLILVFVTLVVTVFSALFVSRITIDPVLTLAQAADRMSRGDLSQRVAITSKDELGSLAMAFNNMASGLERIDQAKSEFVALMSHQLRTPTTAVKGFITMLLDGYAGKLSPKQVKLLEGAFEENERQVRIVGDILMVAAANSDQMSIIKSPTDLNAIITNVIDSQSAVLQHLHQKVIFSKPKETVVVSVDPEKIRMAVENIVSNAIKYSPAHTTITITLRRALRRVTIEVTDQGFGIASNDMHKLFQKFSRLDNPHATQAQGSGLGLYLVKKIVELHQGDVTVRSEVGQGTTITLRLPVGEPVASKAPALNSALQES